MNIKELILNRIHQRDQELELKCEIINLSWYEKLFLSHWAYQCETCYLPRIILSTFLDKVALQCGFNSTLTAQLCKLNQSGQLINDIYKSHINHFDFQNLLQIFISALQMQTERREAYNACRIGYLNDLCKNHIKESYI